MRLGAETISEADGSCQSSNIDAQGGVRFTYTARVQGGFRARVQGGFRIVGMGHNEQLCLGGAGFETLPATLGWRLLGV